MQTVGFLNNTNADVKLLGLEASLSPFLEKVSSQRTAMFSSHLVQSLVIEGNEYPKISTGYESLLGKYEFNKTNRDQDMQIIDIIPKFVPNVGIYPIKENSSTTIVYLGMDDNKIHYFNLDKYTKGSDGFGYLNIEKNTHLLSRGNLISKELPLTSSPALKDNFYNMGTNANVVYLTVPQVTEDAFVISKSLARKMKTTAIKTISISISPNQIPLNLYGDQNEYKYFPDIGDTVRDDGIMCAFRVPSSDTFISDMTEQALTKPNVLHDMLYCAPAGSVILDVDFYINRNKRNRTSKTIYNQVFKYSSQIDRYYKKIIEIYQKKVAEGYEISPEFNTLVTKAMVMVLSEGGKVSSIDRRCKLKLIQKKEPVEFIQMNITYLYEVDVAVGFKITDRNGGEYIASLISNN